MMGHLSSLLSLLLLHSSLACSPSGERSRRSTASQEHPATALHRDILDGYNKDVIPILTAPSTDSADNAVIFNFGIQMVRMDMDEKKKVLTATTWPKMSWMDFRLKWNPDHYSGVQNVKIPATKVWRPDIGVYNTVTNGPDSYSERMKDPDVNVIVYSSGYVLYIPAVDIKVPCTKKSKDFACQIKMGSWTYDAFHMNMNAFDNKTYLDLNQLGGSSPYLITSQEGNSLQTKYYDCCSEPYQSMSYNFTVRRASALEAPLEEYMAAYKDGLLETDTRVPRLRGY